MKNKLLLIALTLIASPIALAHIHHSHAAMHPFVEGFLHPLTGIDHLLMALGFGFLCYQGTRKTPYAGALALAAFMLAGFVFVLFQPISANLIEGAIKLSLGVLVVSLLLSRTQQVAAKLIALAVIACLFAFHGMAHALEAETANLYFASAMTISMLSLFAGGALIAYLFKKYLGKQKQVAH